MFAFDIKSDGASYLAGAKATGADANSLVSTVVVNTDFSYVGLPSSRSLTLGVRYVVTESNALAADRTFCHCDTPPYIYDILFIKITNVIIIAQSLNDCKRIFTEL